MANRRADDGLLARRMLTFGALADERSSAGSLAPSAAHPVYRYQREVVNTPPLEVSNFFAIATAAHTHVCPSTQTTE